MSYHTHNTKRQRASSSSSSSSSSSEDSSSSSSDEECMKIEKPVAKGKGKAKPPRRSGRTTKRRNLGEGRWGMGHKPRASPNIFPDCIPNEICAQIASMLPYDDAMRLGRTCNNMRAVVATHYRFTTVDAIKFLHFHVMNGHEDFLIDYCVKNPTLRLAGHILCCMSYSKFWMPRLITALGIRPGYFPHSKTLILPDDDSAHFARTMAGCELFVNTIMNQNIGYATYLAEHYDLPRTTAIFKTSLVTTNEHLPLLQLILDKTQDFGIDIFAEAVSTPDINEEAYKCFERNLLNSPTTTIRRVADLIGVRLECNNIGQFDFIICSLLNRLTKDNMEAELARSGSNYIYDTEGELARLIKKTLLFRQFGLLLNLAKRCREIANALPTVQGFCTLCNCIPVHTSWSNTRDHASFDANMKVFEELISNHPEIFNQLGMCSHCDFKLEVLFWNAHNRPTNINNLTTLMRGWWNHPQLDRTRADSYLMKIARSRYISTMPQQDNYISLMQTFINKFGLKRQYLLPDILHLMVRFNDKFLHGWNDVFATLLTGPGAWKSIIFTKIITTAMSDAYVPVLSLLMPYLAKRRQYSRLAAADTNAIEYQLAVLHRNLRNLPSGTRNRSEISDIMFLVMRYVPSLRDKVSEIINGLVSGCISVYDPLERLVSDSAATTTSTSTTPPTTI